MFQYLLSSKLSAALMRSVSLWLSSIRLSLSSCRACIWRRKQCTFNLGNLSLKIERSETTIKLPNSITGKNRCYLFALVTCKSSSWHLWERTSFSSLTVARSACSLLSWTYYRQTLHLIHIEIQLTKHNVCYIDQAHWPTWVSDTPIESSGLGSNFISCKQEILSPYSTGGNLCMSYE